MSHQEPHLPSPTRALAAGVAAGLALLVGPAVASAAPQTGLHFKAEIRAGETHLDRGRADSGGHVDAVIETWQGGGRLRSVVDGGEREITLRTASGRGRVYQRSADLVLDLDVGRVD